MFYLLLILIHPVRFPKVEYKGINLSICKLNTWNNLTRKDFKTIPVIESNIQFKKKFRLETRYRQKLESWKE